VSPISPIRDARRHYGDNELKTTLVGTLIFSQIYHGIGFNLVLRARLAIAIASAKETRHEAPRRSGIRGSYQGRPSSGLRLREARGRKNLVCLSRRLRASA